MQNTKASKQLTLHLKVLKEQCSMLQIKKMNGVQIKKEEIIEYLEHKNFVRTLLHSEIYNKIITTP